MQKIILFGFSNCSCPESKIKPLGPMLLNGLTKLINEYKEVRWKILYCNSSCEYKQKINKLMMEIDVSFFCVCLLERLPEDTF